MEVKVLYGVEGNSTFLECIGHSPQAEIRWAFQNNQHQGGRQTQEGRELVRGKL